MATYTGTADGSGDFTIDFGGNSYTSAQKVTVTAEKDAAIKTIELFAPSDVTGGGAIQFSGDFSNFPQNVGVITLTNQIEGSIQANAMRGYVGTYNIFNYAQGLIIEGDVTTIGNYAFADWRFATQLSLPNTVTTIGQYSFDHFGFSATVDFDINLPNSVNTLSTYSFYYSNMKNFDIGSSVTTIPQYCFGYTNKLENFNYRNVTTINNSAFYGSNLKYNLIPDTVTTLQTGCFQYAKSVEVSVGSGITTIPASAFYQNTSCLKFTIGVNVSSIDTNGLGALSACNELICLPTTPPTITTSTLTGLKTTCVIKVPSASLTAYQTATNWSVHASKMVGV